MKVMGSTQNNNRYAAYSTKDDYVENAENEFLKTFLGYVYGTKAQQIKTNIEAKALLAEPNEGFKIILHQWSNLSSFIKTKDILIDNNNIAYCILNDPEPFELSDNVPLIVEKRIL